MYIGRSVGSVPGDRVIVFIEVVVNKLRGHSSALLSSIRFSPPAEDALACHEAASISMTPFPICTLDSADPRRIALLR